jgi:hypothetical protein
MRIRFLALALGTIAGPAIAASAPPPPSVPIHEPTVTSFTDATFTFSVPKFETPIDLAIHMRPYDPASNREIESFTVSYGSSSVTVGRDQVADMPAPDLVQTRATALISWRGDTVIVIYFYETRDCGTRCGIVEFDWTVGGKVQKIDQR